MKRTPKYRKWPKYLIIISLLIFLVPLSVLGYSGYKAVTGKGKPIVGSRFNNDLDPMIEDSQIDEVVSLLQNTDGFLDVKASLKTAVLRIYILNDATSEELIIKYLNSAYKNITSILDDSLYFTSRGIQKQYDLEIHAYNIENVTDENKADYHYGILTKNGNMEKANVQIVSSPMSQEMVDFFYEEERQREEELAKEQEWEDLEDDTLDDEDSNEED